MASTKGCTVTVIRKNYAVKVRRVVDDAAARLAGRGAPPDHPRLVAYLADKVDGRANPATWHAIEADYPEVVS
jgi:hypothetical protein